MPVCERISVTSIYQVPGTSDEEDHTEVLKEIMYESFKGNEEASALSTKLGIRSDGSCSSRKTVSWIYFTKCNVWHRKRVISNSAKGHRPSTSRNIKTQQSTSQPTRTQHEQNSTSSEVSYLSFHNVQIGLLIIISASLSTICTSYWPRTSEAAYPYLLLITSAELVFRT